MCLIGLRKKWLFISFVLNNCKGAENTTYFDTICDISFGLCG